MHASTSLETTMRSALCKDRTREVGGELDTGAKIVYEGIPIEGTLDVKYVDRLRDMYCSPPAPGSRSRQACHHRPKCRRSWHPSRRRPATPRAIVGI